MSEEKTIDQKIEEVNKLLQEHEPENISFDSYGGYTGYKPQYVVRACNKVLGYSGWSFEEQEMKITGDSTLAICKLKVAIKGIEKTVEAYGQSRITKGDIGDAMKGAQTDALKKALSYFDIGQRAYFGLLPKPKNQKKTFELTSRKLDPTAPRKTCVDCGQEYNPKEGTEAWSTKCYPCFKKNGKKVTATIKDDEISMEEIPFE